MFGNDANDRSNRFLLILQNANIFRKYSVAFQIYVFGSLVFKESGFPNLVGTTLLSTSISFNHHRGVTSFDFSLISCWPLR